MTTGSKAWGRTRHQHAGPDGDPMRFRNMTDEQLQAEINRLLAEAGIVPQEK